MTTEIDSLERLKLVQIGDMVYDVVAEKKGSKYSSFKLESYKCTEESAALEVHSLLASSELVVIDSICSGVGRTGQNDFYNNVMKPVFKEANFKHKYIRTEGEDSIKDLATKFEASKDYTIIFLSGDTSVSEFINNLTKVQKENFISCSENKRQMNIFTIPLGTGNALASSIHLSSPHQVFQKFLNNELIIKDFPLYTVTLPNKKTIIFFIIFSMGFHANLLHACDSDEYQKMGTERFAKASENIFKNYDLNIGLTTKNGSESISRNYAYFAIINTPNLELNYMPSPDSDVFKNELHLLGYDASLSTEKLVNKIMAGYSYKEREKINNKDNLTYYYPVNLSGTGLQIILETDSDKKLEKYKYDICCDGLLLNLDDINNQHGVAESNKNKITISKFPNDLNFQLNLFA
ncbi:hypothetical protein TPHA_0D04620 [Tetrapisispora phaffii CBS 4417]|uniref:DAGKc domain-containing protein n=1 Tax=Tetrapisispora phaffii (strain ATCC 24235 / CBS 4417 / NBRC 1672 / NRRL Y-8282 / UCD 70-5) TaxID=1071381 RepID=G8BS22_TETPH|nr:hypothetical protein TPHA_0D04620 [Tetrapisispora phaffii CBS 4417]CCE63097.1 hypothetical protein TPHA_0D04620 [Tetrapisispora phaffii CBS 4417]